MRNIFALIAAAVVISITSASSASAGWACKVVSSNGAFGVAWAAATKEEASAVATGTCVKSGGVDCRVEGCRPNVDTQEQLEAIWPRPAAIVNCKGAAKGC